MRNFKECAEMRKAVRILCGRMVSEIVMTGDPPAIIQQYVLRTPGMYPRREQAV